MQLLSGFLVSLALQTVGAQWPDEGESTTETEVISIHDVWNRSICQPLEKLVDIMSEYPSEVEHVFSPSCVPLHRCSGCCGDETQECVPTETATVTMEVMKTLSEEMERFVELSFVEHKDCACSPRIERLKSERKKQTKEHKKKRAKQKKKD